MQFILIIVILLILGILYLAFENKNLAISNYILEQDSVPNAFDGLKMVCISDLHNNLFGTGNERLIKKIKELSPDLILISGDMITASEPHKNHIAMELLERLAKDYPVYFSPGNHECKWQMWEEDKNHIEPQKTAGKSFSKGLYEKKKENSAYSFEDFLEKLKEMGVIYLDNMSIDLYKEGDSIRITGLNLPLSYFKKGGRPIPLSEKDLTAFAGHANSKGYQILLAHMPCYFKEYASWGADFILSGHVHGGVMRLPYFGGVISPQYEIFPAYDAGLFKEGDSIMLLSRGLGTHTIPVRVFNRPELICVELRRKSGTRQE
ncbi:MAG: hypothetical protein E7256_02225 [Lachnospiraceae bacterium]|nr:hypothetical protein [Lachnospiraceae bacterium]